MPEQHECSIEEQVEPEGRRVFVARCACGWTGVPSTGTNAKVVAEWTWQLHGGNPSGVEASDAAPPIETWVGLLELEARPGSDLFDAASGAIANAVSVAIDAADYARRVSAFFDLLGVDILEFSDVESVRERQDAHEVPEAILTLAATAAESGEVQCDTYYLFPADDVSEEHITVTHEAGLEEVLAEVATYARGWLEGALEHYPDGFEIGAVGIAFSLRPPNEPASVGYACSDGRPSAHVELFRAAAVQAEDRDE